MLGVSEVRGLECFDFLELCVLFSSFSEVFLDWQHGFSERSFKKIESRMQRAPQIIATVVCKATESIGARPIVGTWYGTSLLSAT